MSHNCFISFKKEDRQYKDKIVEKLGKSRITGKVLDRVIDSDNIDTVMQAIRSEYMSNTTVTIFLIGRHSSENEGLDAEGYNKQSFVIRELQATLYDRDGNPRDGLLGVVLPEMEEKVYLGVGRCEKCDCEVSYLGIDDSTVIREFSENYWLERDECGHCPPSGHFAVLCRYSEFMNDPERYINMAYDKTKEPIAEKVHFKDIKHKGRLTTK